MSRQERFDCTALIVGLLALLLMGWHQSQPATASPAAAPTVAVQQPAAADSEPAESDRDREANYPSGVAGMTVAELHADAAATLASLPQQAPSGQYTGIPQYAASYEGSVPTFPATYFTLESHQSPGVFHVFNVVAALRA